MKKLIILALLAATAFAAKIDLSKIRPRQLKRNTVPGTLYPRDARITGGQEAGLNQFPYQVASFLDDLYFCGGSIISSNWVLTAAHCIDGISSAELYFGIHNIFQDDGDDQMIVSSSAFTIHPDWNPATVANDIALIHLPRALSFNVSIQPVLLPRLSDVDNYFTNALATASGWGKTSDDATGISKYLNFVQVNVIANARCYLVFGSIITNTNICIDGALGKSTCNGDSGGPLVVYDELDRAVLIGATSFGAAAGCEKGYPAVFARITAHLTWINNVTGIPLRP